MFVSVLVLFVAFTSFFSDSSLQDSYAETIIEETVSTPQFSAGVLSSRSSLQGAVLFLTTQKEAHDDTAQVSGGLFDDTDGQNLETVGRSALAASSPTLTIFPEDGNSSSSSSGHEALTYVVEEGDSLSTIAQDFGVSLETLLWENDISSRTTLQPGDKIAILPVDGVRHTVSRGDTISSIAKNYDASAEDILAFNGIQDAGRINIGDDLIIPGGSESSTNTTHVSHNTAPANPVSSLSRLADDYFQLPIAQGRMTQGLHSFNAVDLGGHGHCNTPIYAAADGAVITEKSAGWNGGYGKYIKISHPNGTATLYAHNSQNLVSINERVTKGQVIALMGTTGNSTGCHVHFSVRGVQNPFAR